MSISVVIISKNQDWNIERVINSVKREMDRSPITEIILVDSASTDRTVHIALQMNIKVIEIKSALRYTAAAGRYIGAWAAKNDLILFLDGDMELREGWIDLGYKKIIEDIHVGVVSAPWINVYKNHNGRNRNNIQDQQYRIINPKSQRHIGGAGLYRKKSLLEVGSFNPCLYSDEEPALLLLLEKAGYVYLKLSDPIVYHYEDVSKGFRWLLRRRSKKLWIGIGQNVRHLLNSPLLFPYLKERGFGCIIGLWLFIALLAVFMTLFLGNVYILVVIILMSVFYIGKELLRQKSMKRMIFSLVQRILIFEAMIRGFFDTPTSPRKYWANLKITDPEITGM